MSKATALKELKLIIEYFEKSSEEAVQEVLDECFDFPDFEEVLDEIYNILIEGESP